MHRWQFSQNSGEPESTIWKERILESWYCGSQGIQALEFPGGSGSDVVTAVAWVNAVVRVGSLAPGELPHVSSVAKKKRITTWTLGSWEEGSRMDSSATPVSQFHSGIYFHKLGFSKPQPAGPVGWIWGFCISKCHMHVKGRALLEACFFMMVSIHTISMVPDPWAREIFESLRSEIHMPKMCFIRLIWKEAGTSP